MGRFLVKVYLKADDILLAEPVTTPSVDIRRPIFNLTVPVQVAVVSTLIAVDKLIAECHFRGSLMVAANNHGCTDIRLYLAVRLERMIAQFVQPLFQAFVQSLVHIAQRMNLSVTANLKIQVHACLIVSIGRITVEFVYFVIVPSAFILVRFRTAE